MSADNAPATIGRLRSPGWFRWLLVAEVALALLIGLAAAIAPGMFSSVQFQIATGTVLATAFRPALVTLALAILARLAWYRGGLWLAIALAAVPPLIVVVAMTSRSS